MNDQKDPILSTISQVKKPRTGTRRTRGRKPNNGDHSFLKAKKSQIPTPIEKENKKTLTIDWGLNNLYPYYLNFIFKNNPIHGGIVRSKVDYTVSGGLIYDGQDVKKWDSFYKNGKVDYMQKNMDELMNDISLDFEKSNMFCFLVKCNIVGPEKTYKKTERIPFEKIRFEYLQMDNKQVELTGNIKTSEDWNNSTIVPDVIKPYNGKGNQREFYVIYQEDSGQSLDEANSMVVNPGFYPSPPYAGAITAIDTGIEIDKYNNAEIHNGFSLGTIISMHNGRIQDESKKKKFEQGLRAAATGADQTGGIFITYGNGKEETTKVESLNGNDLPDRYTNTKQGAIESVLQAHSVTTPILFGVKTEGSLGNATELEIGYSIMKDNYFTNRQNTILRPLNWIAKTFAGLKGEITFAEVNLNLETQIEEDGNPVAKALNTMSPLLATKVLEKMTANEIRLLGGLQPIEGGDDVSPTEDITEVILSKQDIDVIEQRLNDHGTDKDQMKVIKTYPLKDLDDVKESDAIDKFRSEFAKLNPLQAQVLNLRNDGNGFTQIKNAMDISADGLARIYRVLIESKLMESNGKITNEGLNQLAASDIERIEVLYEYKLRPDAPALVPGGKSRDFCVKLLELNRLYTRDEINIIAGVEGYNVFAYRGGWYHNPKTQQNEPGCRHEWMQVVTLK